MDNSLFEALRNILVYCREMRELLKSDLGYFIKNDFTQIENSNQRKVELINKLNRSTETISQGVASDDQALQVIAKQIREEISECYKELVKNSHLVYTNIHQLKEIADKLSACRTGVNSLYDNAGQTVIYNHS